MSEIIINLPSSKSISNRILIINALSGNQQVIENLSEAQDTKDLYRCLSSDEADLFVGEGATTLRFLLSFLCLKNINKTLRCSPSLQKRPITTLLEMLSNLNCKFNFTDELNQLPIQLIHGITEPYPNQIEIDTSKTSQFVSSLLLIAPYLKDGLEIYCSEQMVSEPYINMTIKLMNYFGIDLTVGQKIIKVLPGNYLPMKYRVESDWSSASFFYCALALQTKGNYFFPNLIKSNLQGDEIISQLFEKFGITSQQEEFGIRITRNFNPLPDFLDFDFTNCPDLFPPISIFCAIKKVNAKFSGLQHLRHKESNRLKIINDFLEEQAVKIQITENNVHQISAVYQMELFDTNIKANYSSHSDHRIAMAFSLLNFITKTEIENADVVRKSFPDFWKEFAKTINNTSN